MQGGSGGQFLVGGTGASEELYLRGTQNANLGQVRLGSPIRFDDVTAANALNPYSIQDSSTNVFTAGFVGGTFADQRIVSFSNALFIYETLRGAPQITSLVNPAFAAFTLFQGLPALIAGPGASDNPLQAIIVNAGPSFRSAQVGTRTAASSIGINAVTTINPQVSGATLAVTTIEGMRFQPQWNTVAGSTANFNTMRAVRCTNPTQALFGSSAGLEIATAHIGLDYENITSFGNITKAAVRSAQAAASNAYFLLQTGSAQSQFLGQIRIPADLTGITMGASDDWQMGWGAANFLFWQFNGLADQLRFSNPSADRFLFDTNGGNTVAEYNFNCLNASFGAQTGTVGNQHFVFVAGAKTVGVAGEYSQVLLTQGGNLTVPFANMNIFAWTINAASTALSGPGSITTAAALNIGGNPNQGTNRVGLRIISNPTGGAGVNAALWVTAGLAQFDGNVLLGASGSSLGFYGATPVVRSAAYTVTNHTVDRTYDANASSTSELADVLGTLLLDLINNGLMQGSVT